MNRTLRFVFVCACLCAATAFAKIDLVTLPERDRVQLTIYNSADLTLARDTRTLTLKRGINALQFSWANTLIDPTSLEFLPLKSADRVDVAELSFPPRVRELGLWRISSQVADKIPVEISYFTSGISWRAYYLATLSADEKKMDLEGYVIVTNRSGEEYENAQVRLVVGKVHILDEIAALARRAQPFGRPEEAVSEKAKKEYYERARMDLVPPAAAGMAAPKQIVKEGLSEYFIYTIEGTETIPNGWAKRLASFRQDGIPVVNLYRYEEERFGQQVIRFLAFVNGKSHGLGKEPLPDGLVKVFGRTDDQGHLRYVGADTTKYIPVDQKVELNLGPARDVEVEPKLMECATKNYLFNAPGGNISGWDEVQTWKVKVSNRTRLPVKVEVKRNLKHQYWEMDKSGDSGTYEREDVDTVKFTLELAPYSAKEFSYTVTYFEGDRRDRR